MRMIKSLFSLSLLVVLSGCIGSNNQDLRDWVAEVKDRPATPMKHYLRFVPMRHSSTLLVISKPFETSS